MAEHASTQKKLTEVKGPSPFMAQYLDIKAEHPDALLFFRAKEISLI